MARKILLADDSVTAQNMGRKILADAGYEVITVNNGSAALKKIAELKPDLVILDVYMPGYSGLEVCQRLKESRESARIPVLLTVGKLEPFKPEEAQRVRAEGFIVKPFEASELLSALSKLEDKVVPRAEPSKPGRFARAIAAAEEAGRISRNDASDDNGWRSRIAFPREKTGQEQVADDTPIYNPVNRDLRTMVESPAEIAADRQAESKATEKKAEKPQSTAETYVDVAALAPAGLPQDVMPQDVTPEEVAAIAAAAAQIQVAAATIKDEQEALAAETSATPDLVSERAVDSSSDIRDSSSPALNPALNNEGQAEVVPEVKESAASQDHALETELRGEPEGSDESQDLPVTMAAATDSVAVNEQTSRWAAVSIPLNADEGAISLEQEMQKAYAAFSAQGTASANLEVSSDSAPLENSSAAKADAEETHADAISSSDAESAPESQPIVVAEASSAEPTAGETPTAEWTAAAESATAESTTAQSTTAESTSAESRTAEPAAAESAPVPQLDAAEASFIDAASVSEPATASIPQSESASVEAAEPAYIEAAPATSSTFSEANHEPVAELPSAPVDTAIVSEPLSPTPESEPATTTTVTGSPASNGAFASIIHAEPAHAEPAEEHKEESETVKSTAAAWASWRQVRDTSDPKPLTPEPASQQSDVSQLANAESAAMAVAAGAERNLQENAVPPAENPADVASIVDSVLADLRPRLMAEITRKMSEKK